MDAKITLSFNQKVIENAKAFASSQGMSLSRLTEFIFEKITSEPKSYKSLEDIPLADFIYLVAEEQATYKKTTKSNTSEYYESRK